MQISKGRAIKQRALKSVESHAPLLAAFAMILIMVFITEPAFAQAADPFADAVAAACEIQERMVQLASGVGMVAITICLMLGYFNKLNWNWLATGIGVSFCLGTVPGWIMSLAGGGC